MQEKRMTQQVWFTSDTHFGHANIVTYSGRPFADVNEMDEALVLNWNAVVKPGDVVYHVGDFALCDAEIATKIVKRLAGQKYLVFGNHDKRLRKDKSFLENWIWAKDLADITVGEQRVVLMHYAMRVWNQSHRGAWQLHGHSHGSLKEDPHLLQADVGVDCWDQRPVSFEEIATKMAKKDYQPVDHHGRKDE
jgi:calcineurin-like phosphoesterase family protein